MHKRPLTSGGRAARIAQTVSFVCGDRVIPVVLMILPSDPVEPKARVRASRTAAAYRYALVQHGAQVAEMRPGDGAADLVGVDGVLLTGGGDLDSRYYGQGPHPRAETPDPARDDLELAVTRTAIERDVPILGICRGAQVLGVALGGQLVQDIDSELPAPEEHRSGTKGRTARHWVELAPGSRLAEVMLARRIRVNSFHHQANSVLAAGVVRAAWCADGVTEAIEAEGTGFVIGVQWHPERMWRRSPRQRRLFAAFVEACRQAGEARPRQGG
jgi:putative glutamine amidotransferase